MNAIKFLAGTDVFAEGVAAGFFSRKRGIK
jgi:hypothetical protein